jgi:DNA repair exonuclease SbcCD ATPase subunit
VRLEKCVFRGIGPFEDEWCFDTTQFSDDQKLIALTGLNGRGKSFTLEASIIGALYGSMPTHGTIVGRARAADTLLESTIWHKGKRWTIKHLIDALQSHSNVVVTGEAGALWKKAGPKVFRQWVEENMPEKSVVLASLFSHQKSEGFVDMTSGERIAVLLRVIGLDRLERKAKMARELATAEKKKLDEVLGRIADVRGDVASAAVSRVALEAARAEAVSADELVADAKATLARVQLDSASYAAKKATRGAAQALQRTLGEQLAGARTRLATAETGLAAARALQTDAVAIRAAVELLPAEELALADLRAAYAAADAGVRAELDPWRDGSARRAAAAQRRVAAQGRLADEQAILAAVASKGALKEAAEAERGAVAGAEAAVEALGAKHVAGLGERVAALRGGLEEVADCELSDARVTAQRTLTADDAAVEAATEVPKQLAAAKEKLRVARERQAAADRKLAEAERLAARETELPAARTDLESAEKELADLLSGHAVAVVTALARALARLDVAMAGKAKAAALEPLRRDAARAADLAASEARIAELEPQVSAGRVEVSECEERLAAVVIEELGDVPDVASAERGLAAAEARAKAGHESATKAESALARSEEVDAKVFALEEQRSEIEAELADWTRLALDHGRGGMQAAEIDNVGPELTTYMQDILRNCVGTRWSMYARTQHLDADGKKMVEGCEIRVIDNQTGEDREVKEHSGGERATLAETISSAITMLGCSRMGFDRPTLVRDESTNFLDPDAALQWVKMMRHVVAFTKADRLLFVSHNPEVVRLADATIEPPARRITEISSAA